MPLKLVFKGIIIVFEGFLMKLIAITGSIGCGKTTIANIINKLGYCVFDVDGWVRSLYFQKDFIDSITKQFPSTLENGVFNKRRLRNVVFDNNEELKKLEYLIHPFLSEKLKKVIRRNAKSDDLYFIDVALLFEMGWDKYCDLVLVADVNDKIQMQRVMKRDNVSAEHFEKINNVQMSKKDKIALADVVIETDVPLNLLKVEILSIIEGLK